MDGWMTLSWHIRLRRGAGRQRADLGPRARGGNHRRGARDHRTRCTTRVSGPAARGDGATRRVEARPAAAAGLGRRLPAAADRGISARAQGRPIRSRCHRADQGRRCGRLRRLTGEPREDATDAQPDRPSATLLGQRAVLGRVRLPTPWRRNAPRAQRAAGRSRARLNTDRRSRVRRNCWFDVSVSLELLRERVAALDSAPLIADRFSPDWRTAHFAWVMASCTYQGPAVEPGEG